jgi:protease-4
MKFFKQLLAAFLGSTLAIIIGGLLLMVIFFAAVSAMSGGEGMVTEVDDNSVLRISMGGAIIERANDNMQQVDLGPFGQQGGIGLNHIIEDIEKAKRDDRIEGIYLHMPSVSAQPSTIYDIREALVDFKESGKWIVCYAETMGQGTYYVASVADEIYMYPEGDLSFFGLSAEMMYFKGLLEKLDVEIQVLRGPNNKYKSAVEPYIKDHMSDPAKEQMTALLDDIWRIMLQGISSSRDISVNELNRIADNMEIILPSDAVEKGLIDGLKYEDEVNDLLKAKLGIETEFADAEDTDDDEDEESDDDINFVDFSSYRHAYVKDESDSTNYKSDRVAVVYAVGAIESGEGDDQTIGSERIAGALRDARLDDKVKAVVLRVNSPGGSALASDVIWRETQLIKEAGKPFVVSMGDLAASGGYYISCAADEIFANENTITGSIGVFGMLPNFEKFYNDKLGITFDRVNTNDHADLMSTNKKLDAVQDSAINVSITRIYNRFLQIVAEGREMSTANVDSIARGRVWSGIDAQELGLVDQIGDLEAAIGHAAGLADMSNYRLRELPKMIDPFQEFIEELTGEAQINMLKEELGGEAEVYEKIREFKDIIDSKEIQARMPYFLEIK